MRGFKGHLKLLVLHIISQEPSHGYSIMKKISELIGAEPPSSGALYPILASLKRRKFIEEQVEGRRKVYSLTKKGKKFLSENEKNLKEALLAAERLKEFYELGGKELKNVAVLIFKNLSHLSSSQKDQLKTTLKELERKIQRIIYGGE
ncbi:PadR family transcriptional regulator [Thermotoga sp.]|uniref:PadR family transcriptional regulator n=1 Tax=Thermotoga sp. TaxID=28240 RepID=UPI0025D5D4EB|nr:PadR family transcriptional regulator [Thermotoga sp.]MCD6552309.1 PadR family transcriptional regulator [Thermotoga sp.]